MPRMDTRLQVDAAGPALAHFREDRPARPVLRRRRIEVGAHQRRAVGVGGAEREIHAPRDVVGAPVLLAVVLHGIERAGECAVGIGPARPDVALVDVGMHVDEARPHHAAVEVELGQSRASPGRVDALDRAVLDRDVGANQAIAVGFAGVAIDQYRRQRGVRQDEARLAWNLGEAFGHCARP